MEELQTIELFIDEENIDDGVQAISLVEFPAIEENFVALNKHEVEFKTLNEEKRIIVGLALVPNKKIYRRNKDYEYNIIFSEETVRKASEIYLKNLRNNNTTLEHNNLTTGVSVVESWVVEDASMDKSNLYGLNAVKGAWVVVMKVDNDAVWKDIKDKKYLGLSIEGMFSDNVDLSREELESYTDYPQGATNNAKRALAWKEKNGSSCGTSVGWARARQLADRKPISKETISRMASFKRHQQHKDVPYSEGCGGLMYDAWGGDAGINWASRKLEKLSKDEELLEQIKQMLKNE